MAEKQHKVNPFYVTAVLITDRLCPDGVAHPADRERTLTITLKGLSRLCGLSAKQHGWPQYDLTLVYLAWMALCDKAICEDWGRLPNIEAITRCYTKDSKPWIEAWPKIVQSDVPEVWDSKRHDDYVREHADVLRLVGFEYRGWSTPESQTDGSRITYSEIETLGLLPK